MIPLNPTAGYGVSVSQRVDAFASELRTACVNVTIRDTRGRDIDAACGQLATEARGTVSVPRRSAGTG